MGSEAAGATSLLSSHALAWCVLACLVVAVAVVALLMRRRLQDANTQLEKLRGRDALTGLPTRADFDLALEASARRCDRGDMPVALLLIGLDGLRQVNEGYGHQVGDALLVEAARRLQGPPASAMGASGLARLGGDEFALIVPAAQATALADALRQLLHRPYRVAGVELQLTASVGVAVYPEHGARTRLLGHAALAMRSVKLVGGGSHAVFHSSMGADQRDQAELVQDLRLAIEKRQLQLYYQPKVDARSLQITGAEALLRWQHPARGMVGPAVFVPLAERHGLIVSIGRWVVEEATPRLGATPGCACAWLSTCRACNSASLSWCRTCWPICVGTTFRRLASRARSPSRWPSKTVRRRAKPSSACAKRACMCRSTTSVPATAAWPRCASCRRPRSRSTALSYPISTPRSR
jgi:diguanylate cyclase (GGDEF)-like protein